MISLNLSLCYAYLLDMKMSLILFRATLAFMSALLFTRRVTAVIPKDDLEGGLLVFFSHSFYSICLGFD